MRASRRRLEAMAIKTFTPVVPNLTTAGATFAGVAAGETGDIIPISNTMRTLVVISNSGSSAAAVTFTSSPDEWGNSGAGVDKVITVPGTTGAPSVVIVGPLMYSRFADINGNCILQYDANIADVTIGVVNVPNASL